MACGGTGEGEITSPCPSPPVAGGRAGLRVIRSGESWAALGRAGPAPCLGNIVELGESLYLVRPTE